MADRTLLDLYRHELERPRDGHYVHYFPGGTRSFSTLDFFGRAAALADSLAGLGVAPGDRVVLSATPAPSGTWSTSPCSTSGRSTSPSTAP
jgi:hypothetical protein